MQMRRWQKVGFFGPLVMQKSFKVWSTLASPTRILGYIRSCDASRPVARAEKFLICYNREYCMTSIVKQTIFYCHNTNNKQLFFMSYAVWFFYGIQQNTDIIKIYYNHLACLHKVSTQISCIPNSPLIQLYNKLTISLVRFYKNSLQQCKNHRETTLPPFSTWLFFFFSQRGQL